MHILTETAKITRRQNIPIYHTNNLKCFVTTILYMKKNLLASLKKNINTLRKSNQGNHDYSQNQKNVIQGQTWETDTHNKEPKIIK